MAFTFKFNIPINESNIIKLTLNVFNKILYCLILILMEKITRAMIIIKIYSCSRNGILNSYQHHEISQK